MSDKPRCETCPLWVANETMGQKPNAGGGHTWGMCHWKPDWDILEVPAHWWCRHHHDAPRVVTYKRVLRWDTVNEPHTPLEWEEWQEVRDA